jgi:hypothetical protein
MNTPRPTVKASFSPSTQVLNSSFFLAEDRVLFERTSANCKPLFAKRCSDLWVPWGVSFRRRYIISGAFLKRLKLCLGYQSPTPALFCYIYTRLSDIIPPPTARGEGGWIVKRYVARAVSRGHGLVLASWNTPRLSLIVIRNAADRVQELIV